MLEDLRRSGVDGKFDSGMSAKLLKSPWRKREERTSGGKRRDSGPAESGWEEVDEEGLAAEEVAAPLDKAAPFEQGVVGAARDDVDVVKPSLRRGGGARE